MRKTTNPVVVSIILASLLGCATSSDWNYNSFQGFSGQVKTANTTSSDGDVKLSILSQEGKLDSKSISFSIPSQNIVAQTKFKCISGVSKIKINIDGHDIGEIDGKCHTRDNIIGIPDESAKLIFSKIKTGKSLKLHWIRGDFQSQEDIFNVYGLVD